MGIVGPSSTSSYGGILATAFLIVFAVTAGCVQQPNVPGYSNPVADPYAAKRWSSPTFTSAHDSLGQAARHFLNIKPEPKQPIEFPHKIHTVDLLGIECQDCHWGVQTGPRAGIPSITFCMSCHEDIGNPANPHIQSLRDHAMRGEDIAWQRVYGFVEESHVRFNHSPHIRAGVECYTCHGDLTQMTVAEKAVDHTMGFCVNCHKQLGASNECQTCHY